MNAIEAISKIIDNCDILLNGEVFSKELLMRTFAEFLSVTTEKDTHNTGFVLHTGSICFDALALAYSLATCLVYNDAQAKDVIRSLNKGDAVLYGKKKKSRYIFRGFTTDPSNPGVDYIHLWTSNASSTYVPKPCWRFIIPYFGTSKTMDGRG